MSATLQVADSGSAGDERPVVVLLHPVGLSGETFAALPPLLPAFRVLRIDLPGHGGSPPLAAGAGMSDFAGGVAETLQQRGLSCARVVGVSFGAMVAQLLALEHPALVQSLVLASCPAGIPAEARAAVRRRGDDALAGGMASIIGPTLERWSAERWPAGVADATAALLHRMSPAAFAATWDAIAGFDVQARLPALRLPVALIAGGADKATAVSAMEALRDSIPGAGLEVWDGAGHMPHLEDAERFARAISADRGA